MRKTAADATLLSGPRRKVIAGGAVVAACVGLTVFGLQTASADTAAPSATSLCIPSGLGLVLTPTSSGRCLFGQTPTDLANLSGVQALSNGVSSLQSMQATSFIGSLQSLPHSYTVPTGVHELRVELWGGGGGGSGSWYYSVSNSLSPGSGGAQGDYTHSVIDVVAGDTCPLTVGSGGLGGPGSTDQIGPAGKDGGTSSFSCPHSLASVIALGGPGAHGFDPGGNQPTSQSAEFQTYAGQPGEGPGNYGSTPGAGGGIGYPGSGGSGGYVGSSTAGTNGHPGLAVITPVG